MSRPRHISEVLRELFPGADINGPGAEEKESAEVEPKQEGNSDDE